MDSSSGEARPTGGRTVGLNLDHRQVVIETSAGEQVTLTYSGILITSYDDGEKVAEKWLPIGTEPTEADDERVIQLLRNALLWQSGKPRPQVDGRE
ncbi:hypothetical protein [Amycolatopsis nigrescens]|uniref:hypothetical protein n=1 Tax=Amycolatopsis nigrescens TaxID=381445 RepID=UPI000591656B|nr:hypothetical protein [Amycolatopsis nigrescens]